MSPNELTEILTSGEISLVGRMPNSSNATFLVEVKHGESLVRGIYKPLKGERPLWDFAPGLHRREVAAYKLSEHLGFGIVPVTVLRDGPYGEGSLQWFVEHDDTEHYFTILGNKPECHEQLRRICAFDIVANNTDRKSGHCLLAPENKIWAIDHGVCFSAEFKLRTVMWEFGGEELPEEILTAIAPLADTVPLDVASLLDDDEVSALQERTQWLIDGGHFPIDRSGTRYPWPLV